MTWSLLVSVLLLLAGRVPCSGRSLAQSTSAAQNSSQVAGLLVDFLQSTGAQISFPAGQWQRNGSSPCTASGSWEYVVCDGTTVTGLNFAGVPLTGSIKSAWTPLLAMLTNIRLSGASLTGTLPASWGSNLTDVVLLDLSSNSLSSSLPSAWGNQGAFPQLQNLTLNYNSLNGTLPSGWGANQGSLQNLQALKIGGQVNGGITGTLPGSWAQQLPSLQMLDMLGSSLTGSLPAAWSAWNLTYLSLSSSHLTGQLPASWGNSWRDIEWMDLSNNLFTGTIPSTWGPNWETLLTGVNGTTNCTGLLLPFNALSGSIPQALTRYGGLVNLPGNNNMCNGTKPLNPAFEPIISNSAPTSRWQPVIISTFFKVCLVNPVVPAATLPQSCLAPSNETDASDQTDAEIAEGLLRFAESIPYFYVIAQVNDSGWEADSDDICSWKYVTCGNDSLGLDLSGLALPGTLQPAWGQDLAAFTSLNLTNTNLQGQLPAAWAQSMVNLQSLNLRLNSKLNGPIPKAWAAPHAFPSLEVLQLRSCSFTGPLPSFDSTAMPRLQYLDLTGTSNTVGFRGTLPASWGTTRNALQSLLLGTNNLTGQIPAEWGKQGAMPALQYVVMGPNRLTGLLPSWGIEGPALTNLSYLSIGKQDLSSNLPATWVNLTRLQILDVHNTGITGSLPPEWSDMQAVQQMYLDNNYIGSSLPAEWGASGSLPQLLSLNLQNNELSGRIPTWGFTGGLPKLQNLSLQSNYLSGRLPAWGADGSGLRQLTHLWVDSESDVCGSLPSGLTVVDGSSVVTSLPNCTGAFAPTPAPVASNTSNSSGQNQSAGQSGSGSLGAGGIAGIAVGVGVGAIIALLLGLLLLKRRKSKGRRAESHQHNSLMSDTDFTQSSTTNGSRDPSPLDIFLTQSMWPTASADPAATQESSPEGLSPLGTRGGGTHGFSPTGPRRLQSGVSGSQASSATQLEMSMLQLDWRVEPYRIKISTRPNGRHWHLGSGGFGTVYKGVMDGVNDVAIKLMKPETLSSGSSIQKFIAEIDVLRACRDQHIVAFAGAFANEDIMYYVVEYCHNGDLYTALADERVYASLSWYQRGKSIALQVARGLFYLHSNGIVHLDIKSPNILLNQAWQAKIADAGLARTLMSKSHLSRTVLGGTYHWQAPETLLGYHASFSADIFSFGVVMLELITATRPVRGQYPEPRVPEQCPAEIEELAAACMSSEPKDRPNARHIIATILELHPDA
ncbi:hypothetical protein WJX73_004586 [Symbiochloris irregularis]|uniref:Protein kinase domain-containing protein n=1 Tax=Symbiochloris irregularis TaxID=706552 RepID=A0AAW1PWG1_9CHLO